jgi:serine protease
MPLRVSTIIPPANAPNTQHPFWQAGDAVRYAADNGAKVANMSLGWALNDLPIAVINKLTQDVQYAVSKGVVVVISAGNSGTASTINTRFPANLATLPGVIVVGSTNVGKLGNTSASNSTSKISGFSTSAGSSISRYVTAPGENVSTTSFDVAQNNSVIQTYANANGTSFSAPIVAAAAAILRQAAPGKTPEEIVTALLQTADSSGLYL